MAQVSVAARKRSLWSGRIDLLQALTGICLALFILLHFFIISTVLISPKVMSTLDHAFEVVYLTQIGLPGLFIVILLHFLLAARKMPFRAKELTTYIKHAKMLHHPSTWVWLIQVVTAICILALFAVHIYEVWMGLPVTLEGTTARVARSGAVCFYGTLLIVTLVHALVGLFRVLVKFGFITRAIRKKAMFAFLIVGVVYVVMALGALMRLYSLA